MPYEVPVFDLGNPLWIRAVAVTETPDALRPFDGDRLAVLDPGNVPPIGTRGIVRVNNVEVPGYLRISSNGEYEWVLMPRQDPMEVFIVGLPGWPNGWANTDAGMVWYNIGLALRGAGISGQDIANGFNQLFQAAKVEVLAEQAQQSASRASKS